MKQAERRKREHERRLEREIQKEREAESEEFKDKEEFITSAYRKKLEEFKKLDEEERRQDQIDGWCKRWSCIASKCVSSIKTAVLLKSILNEYLVAWQINVTGLMGIVGINFDITAQLCSNQIFWGGIQWGSTNLPCRICRHVCDYLYTNFHASSSNALLIVNNQTKS